MFACLSSPSTPHEELERIARNFSPRIECPSPSIVVLDISGLDRLLGDPAVIAEELLNAVPPAVNGDLPPSVAVAGTRVAAEILARTAVVSGFSRTPRFAVIVPGEEAAALAPLPLDVLLHLGAPPDLPVMLERWGIRTLQAFAALPADRLASRIGQDGLHWQRIARGEDSRPLVPARMEERFEGIVDLEWPVDGLEPLAFLLGGLLEPLCTQLELRDRAVAAIELRLRLTVSKTWRMRRLELPAPTRDPRLLRTLLCLDLEGHPEVFATQGDASVEIMDGVERIDRLGVFIEPTPGPVLQHSLLARPGLTTMSPDVIATLMARLRALMGEDRCGAARLLDTHRPDAFAMDEFRVPGINVAPDLPSTSLGPGKVGPTRNPETTRRTLPVRRALRRLRHPIPARVAVEHGRPVRVTTDRHGWSGGRVTWCAGPWRSSGDWWSVLYRRQEWDVSLADKASYRIHEDRLLRRWFIEAVLD